MNTVSMALQVNYTKLSREVEVALRVPRVRDSTVRGTAQERVAWEFVLHHFPDNGYYSTLDTLLVQYTPRVCVVSPDLVPSELKKVVNLLESHQIEHERAPKKVWFRDTEIETDICRLIGVEKTALNIEQRYNALSGLIKYLELMSNPNHFGAHALVSRDLTSVMQLDGTAISALNLLPEEQSNVEFSSLFHVLNRGKTPMGNRLLNRWIRMPLLDPVEIARRHAIVSLFVEQSSICNELLDEGMKFIPDFEKLAHRLLHRLKTITLDDLVALYDAIVDILPRIDAILTSNDELSPLMTPYHEKLQQILSNFAQYVAMIEQVVDLKARPNVIINPQHDEELSELKEQWDVISDRIEQVHLKAQNSIHQDIKCDKDKMREFVFRLTDKKQEKHLASLSDVHICQVLANGIHFNTPELKAVASEHREIRKAYDERQSHLVESTKEIAVTYIPVIEAASQVLAELDVLLGFAQAAAFAGDGYCCPQISENEIDIKGSRHPCLELQDAMSFIPNAFTFDDVNSRFQIVTGPNMGGKSTYIRQLGMLAVMNQIGSFVPADEAKLPIFDRLLARIGAGDSQQRGVSTFLAEMMQASVILQQATPRSLVIVDELGRGTSTFDGFGLAYAISYHLLTKIRCKCIFATHFHQLTALAQQTGAINKHVTAHTAEGRITMVYQVQPGPCLESFGINVAEMAQFPDSVLNLAKRKAEELQLFEEKQPEDSNTAIEIHEKLHAFAQLPLDQYDQTQVMQKLRTLIQ